jgi:hypothetical protein
MKAYEFPAKVTPDGLLELPPELQQRLSDAPAATVVLVIKEQTSSSDEVWSEMTAQQFLAGYSDTDAIYDQI